MADKRSTVIEVKRSIIMAFNKIHEKAPCSWTTKISLSGWCIIYNNGRNFGYGFMPCLKYSGRSFFTLSVSTVIVKPAVFKLKIDLKKHLG